MQVVERHEIVHIDVLWFGSFTKGGVMFPWWDTATMVRVFVDSDRDLKIAALKCTTLRKFGHRAI